LLRPYLLLAVEAAARCLLAALITGTVPAGVNAVQAELKRESVVLPIIVLQRIRQSLPRVNPVHHQLRHRPSNLLPRKQKLKHQPAQKMSILAAHGFKAVISTVENIGHVILVLIVLMLRRHLLQNPNRARKRSAGTDPHLTIEFLAA